MQDGDSKPTTITSASTAVGMAGAAGADFTQFVERRRERAVRLAYRLLRGDEAASSSASKPLTAQRGRTG